MYPIQPYFAMATTKYFKRPIEKMGIVHIYEYYAEKAMDDTVIAIPDGCIDLYIDEDAPENTCYAAGSVSKGTQIKTTYGHSFFGVRFMPGIIPPFIDGKMSDFIGQEVNLSLCSKVAEPLIEGILTRHSFQEKADCFLEFYSKILSRNIIIKDSNFLLSDSIKKLIEKSAGTMRVSELAEKPATLNAT